MLTSALAFNGLERREGRGGVGGGAFGRIKGDEMGGKSLGMIMR